MGSASQTVKVFRTEGLDFPSRLRGQATSSGLSPHRRRCARAQSTICGSLCVWTPSIPAGGDSRNDPANARGSDWLACIPEAHPGYISWERFGESQILNANGHGYNVARARRPEEEWLYSGDAPSAGGAEALSRSLCRAAWKTGAWYVCDRGHTARGEPNCQSIAGAPITKPSGTRDRGNDACGHRTGPGNQTRESGPIRRAISYAAVPSSAQIEADLAQRRFKLVDPGNRLLKHSGGAERQTSGLAGSENERGRDSQNDIVLDDRSQAIGRQRRTSTLWDDPPGEHRNTNVSSPIIETQP